jgi:hypothetical protein
MNQVKMMPDQPGEADKKYLVGEFVRPLYAVNPATLAPDVKAVLEMMIPQSAATWIAPTCKSRAILIQRRSGS